MELGRLGGLFFMLAGSATCIAAAILPPVTSWLPELGVDPLIFVAGFVIGALGLALLAPRRGEPTPQALTSPRQGPAAK